MNTDLVYLLKRKQFPRGISSVSDYMDTMEDIRKIYKMRSFENPIMYKNNSRYKNLRTLRDSVTERRYHENINTQIVDSSNQDKYVTITIETKNRLDIIALQEYGTPRYWWVLGIANHIIDPFDVPIGTRLRVPPIVSLYNSGGVLSGN